MKYWSKEFENSRIETKDIIKDDKGWKLAVKPTDKLGEFYIGGKNDCDYIYSLCNRFKLVDFDAWYKGKHFYVTAGIFGDLEMTATYYDLFSGNEEISTYEEGDISEVISDHSKIPDNIDFLKAPLIELSYYIVDDDIPQPYDSYVVSQIGEILDNLCEEMIEYMAEELGIC